VLHSTLLLKLNSMIIMRK